MERLLQSILLIGSLGFFIYIINMVRIRKLDLKHTLIWILSSISFLILAIFPTLIELVSEILHIQEPVNSLFLIMIFFLIMNVFSLTITISKNSNSIKTLIQEIGILKKEIKEIKSEKNEAGDLDE